MSRINRLPRGLQDLLGSKNFGVNPSEMGQQVAPIHDLFPHWASERLVARTTTATAPAAQTNVQTFTVPDDEVWLPLHWSATATSVTIADVISFGLMFQQPGFERPSALNAETYLAYVPRSVAAQAIQTFVAAYSWPQRVQFQPGTRFTLRVEQYVPAAGAMSIRHDLIYYRLTI